MRTIIQTNGYGNYWPLRCAPDTSDFAIRKKQTVLSPIPTSILHSFEGGKKKACENMQIYILYKYVCKYSLNVQNIFVYI